MEAENGHPRLQDTVEKQVRLPLLLSRELRWLYYVVGIFLALAGVLFYWIGIRQWFFAGEEVLQQVVLYFLGGTLFFLVGVGLVQVRQYFYRIHFETIETATHAALHRLDEGAFEQFDKVALLREEKAKADFERNVGDAFLIKSVEMKGVAFFGDCKWRLQPGVNILLGRNGYGKSLVLRALAGLLQRNEGASQDLLKDAATDALLTVNIERNGAEESINRDGTRFVTSPGKIPILAIPDSRFVSRSDIDLEAPTTEPPSLVADGARHFLEGTPFGSQMGILFNELCFDFLQDSTNPNFAFLENVLNQLTGDVFKFKGVKRAGPNSFHLLVLTEGNPRPMPIQYASQGTLSVLGVVGIIRRYLRALAPVRRGEDFLGRPAIVLIDELDAHLHPLWQQRLTGILRDTFPNVQFVLTAHSPLVVAGCWVGEVSVLRKMPSGMVVETRDRDYLGTSVNEIYADVFRIESVDQDFVQAASRATSGFNHRERIAALDVKEQDAPLTELERRERARLVREQSMIARAMSLDSDRADDRSKILELEAKIDSLESKLESARVMS